MVEKRLFKLKKKNIKVVIQKIYYYVGMIGENFLLIANSDLEILRVGRVTWVFGKKLGGECWAP